MIPIARTRPVDLAADQLRTSILRGDPPPGAALPAERGLAEALGVSRLTLRAALARLEAEGLVRARQGDAVRVLDPARHGTIALLAHVSPLERPALFRGFLELRRSLAAEVVALATERMPDAALDEVRALVDRQRVEADPARWLDRDLAITRALLEGARNDALVLLFNSVEHVWRAHPALAAALAADRASALAGYDAVLALVGARDPRPVRDAVRAALAALDAGAEARLGGAA